MIESRPKLQFKFVIFASSKDKTKFLEELFINTNSTLIGFEPNNDEFEKLEKDNPRKK